MERDAKRWIPKAYTNFLIRVSLDLVFNYFFNDFILVLEMFYVTSNLFYY